MPAFLYPVLGLPALVIGIAMMVAIAKLTIGPISQAAGLLNAPTRFRLSDFIWLVAQLQVVLAAATRINHDDAPAFGLVLFLSLAATLAMWMAAVSCVSKAGVVNPWRRGVFILCLLPMTLFVMVAIPVCFGSGLLLSFQYLGFADGDGLQIVGYFAISILLGITSWGLRYVSQWVLQGSTWATACSPRNQEVC